MIENIVEQQEMGGQDSLKIDFGRDSLQIEFGRDSRDIIAIQRIMAAGISLDRMGAGQRWIVARQPL
jgi:hypothetical protein